MGKTFSGLSQRLARSGFPAEGVNQDWVDIAWPDVFSAFEIGDHTCHINQTTSMLRAARTL